VAAPFPGKTEKEYGTSNCTTDVLCIPKGAKHPKEAFRVHRLAARAEEHGKAVHGALQALAAGQGE